MYKLYVRTYIWPKTEKGKFIKHINILGQKLSLNIFWKSIGHSRLFIFTPTGFSGGIQVWEKKKKKKERHRLCQEANPGPLAYSHQCSDHRTTTTHNTWIHTTSLCHDAASYTLTDHSLHAIRTPFNVDWGIPSHVYILIVLQLQRYTRTYVASQNVRPLAIVPSKAKSMHAVCL